MQQSLSSRSYLNSALDLILYAVMTLSLAVGAGTVVGQDVNGR